MGMAVILLVFTACDDNADVSDSWLDMHPTETWEMTYDDYHVLTSGETPETHNLKRIVKVSRSGDVICIKGIFKEYPHVWVAGYVVGNKVCFKKTPIDNANGGMRKYFYCGTVCSGFDWGTSHYFFST